MREIQDRRDRITWAYATSQHNKHTTTNTDPHLSYSHPDPCSVSNPLSFSTSYDPSLHSSNSDRLRTSPSPSALLFSLPSIQNLQRQHNRLFFPVTGSQCAREGAPANQPAVQQHPKPDHFHSQFAPFSPSSTMLTETWYGVVPSPRDAYLLLEACRIGKLYRVTRRLTDLERTHIIRPGAVFVWEEKEAGIKRWTDHVRWSPSRVSGAFLIYSELLPASTRNSHSQCNDPLLKQAFSSATLDGDKLHLVAYYSKAALDSGLLPTPMLDNRLREIIVPPGVYPDHRATGGVEDNSTRERQRTRLIPPSSDTSLPPNVYSSNVTNSTSFNVDASRMPPATPTSPGTSIPVPTSEHNYGHRDAFASTNADCSAPVSEPPYLRESQYSPSSYFKETYPIPQGAVTSDIHLCERGDRWEPYQRVPGPVDACGVASRASNNGESYGRTGSPGGSRSIGPTLAPFTAWSNEPAERVNDPRFSAPGYSGIAANAHGFHPYARANESRRPNQEIRVQQSRERDVQSHEPGTTPVTPNPLGSNIPLLHLAQPPAKAGSRTCAESDFKSTAGAQAARPGDHFSSMNQNFANAGPMYMLHPTASRAHLSPQNDDQCHHSNSDDDSNNPTFATHHHHAEDPFYSTSLPNSK